MGRNTADALCIECGEPMQWLIGNPRVCQKCLGEPKGAKKEGRKMSESAWMCQNSRCGLMFRWLSLTHMASYLNSGEKNISVYIPGDTKPNRCPVCGHDEIDSQEG